MQTSNATNRLEHLARAYFDPWAQAGVTQAMVDDAHLHWADYRDAAWGGAVPLGQSNNRLTRINIIDGKLYFVSSVGSKSRNRLLRQQAALTLIASVIREHQIPDVDLVLSISDRPVVPKSALAPSQRPPLVFSYVRTPHHWSVPFPYRTFEPPRWTKIIRDHSTQSVRSRRQQALWRGACNSLCDEHRTIDCSRGDASTMLLVDRYRLLRNAARCPTLVDAGITHAHKNCRGFPKRPSVPMAEHGRYAYLVHVDGNGFSGRLEELLVQGSAVLKEDSPFEAFYYPLLQRGVHYVPLHRNLTDLCATVEMLKRQPDIAAAAAAAASRFAAEVLAPANVAWYVATLLKGYASLQRFQPQRHARAMPWSAASDSRNSAVPLRPRHMPHGHRPPKG